MLLERNLEKKLCYNFPCDCFQSLAAQNCSHHSAIGGRDSVPEGFFSLVRRYKIAGLAPKSICLN